MAKTKWKKSIPDIIEMVTPWCVEQGYPVEKVAQSMVEQFYMGRDRRYATRQLLPPLVKAVAMAKHITALREWDMLREMEEQLGAEGWEWRDDPTSVDAGLWVVAECPSINVNKMGGFWPTREIATKRTFESATRSWLLERTNA